MNDSTAPRRGNGVAVFALIIALAALFFALCYDPFKPGFGLKVPFSSGLSGYDVETASGMYKTMLEVEVKRDARARDEFARRLVSKERKEELETLKIEPEVDFKIERKEKDDSTGEIKILFVSYKRDGKEQKEVVAMEKHRDSGLWLKRDVPLMEIRDKNKELAKRIDDWRAAPDVIKK